jgi:hypothetical protein
LPLKTPLTGWLPSSTSWLTYVRITQEANGEAFWILRPIWAEANCERFWLP